MDEITVNVDPTERGFDPGRLERIGTHFRRYVDDGLLPGWQIVISRHDQVVYSQTAGRRDIEAGAPVEADTIFRIYSMTKPITSVLAMSLWEEGHFELTDPVSRFIPSFEDLRVYRSGNALNPTTEGLTEPMRMWHLLSHTAGLTYGFLHAHPVDARYRATGFDWGVPPDTDLARVCELVAAQPLLFQPGSEWNYSMATDVLGRVIEVITGTRLDQAMAERLFEPLGMVDTGFSVPEAEQHRAAALYSPNPADGMRAKRNELLGSAALSPPTFLGGGGGLVSTAADYQRFVRMLARGGELDGSRILSNRTLAMMTSNQLPGGADLSAYGRPLFAETAFDGIGFGLGFSVVIDPVATRTLCSAGEFAWGGAASTAFWVDPVEDITVIFLTQLLPSSTHPIRTQLKQLTYQALVD